MCEWMPEKFLEQDDKLLVILGISWLSTNRAQISHILTNFFLPTIVRVDFPAVNPMTAVFLYFL